MGEVDRATIRSWIATSRWRSCRPCLRPILIRVTGGVLLLWIVDCCW